ncbi:protein scarlet [Condylostylus longicornis]|uniref:protein scarlet n=1 Tax=Condylostylus longicornis TaxID=2530218 RepID=UPI00244E2429|nr:protein scarlet [Condylostylus longicornis]
MADLELLKFKNETIINETDIIKSNGTDESLLNVNGNNKNSNNGTQFPVRSYNKWSPSEQGATIVWRDLCVYSTGHNQSDLRDLKRIINNSTGAIQPGSLMALMGSSGSGKTTLMSALAYRQPGGTIVQGHILVNGRKIGPFMHRISGYVHQDDIFIEQLTVLEHLTFMANFRLDRRIRGRERKEKIYKLLQKTGLLRCANSRIGSGDERKVLSGGEKKRLAFASELLHNPIILFCDEPTTGLDAYSAQQIVKTLYELAKSGTTILCTIHQPSSQLFSMFNNLLLLADGRVAFTGSPEQALQFFADNGYHCPKSYNSADFLIGVLATDPGHERASERAAQYLCDVFAVSQAAKQRDMLVNLEFHMAESSDYPYETEIIDFRKPFWILTFYRLWYRNSLIVIRDPTVQVLRVLQKMVLALVIGLCFAGTTNLTQVGIQAVQGALFVMISENTFNAMYSMLDYFPRGFPLFLREKSSGLYSTAQYYFSNVLAMLPGLIIEPFLFVIICYWIIGLKPTFFAFGITTICVILVMNVSTACGIMFSTAFNSVARAITFLIPIDYIFMITSGIFIKISTIPAIFYWTQYLSWMLYANEVMSIVQWVGIENITCFQDNNDLPCLHSGQDVLDKYSFNEFHLYWNIFAMFMLYLGLHTLGYLFLWRNSRRI